MKYHNQSQMIDVKVGKIIGTSQTTTFLNTRGASVSEESSRWERDGRRVGAEKTHGRGSAEGRLNVTKRCKLNRVVPLLLASWLTGDNTSLVKR